MTHSVHTSAYELLPATSCGVLKYVLPLPLLECIFELSGKYFCIV